MSKNALLVFMKNMVHGKVKTRLAATIGNDKALEIYKQLVEHTSNIASKVDADKFIFYADEIEKKDMWQNNFIKHKQQGNDLGERMLNAFYAVLQKGFDKAVIIGTDCPQLDKKTIEAAFNKLDKNDAVIGPAFDGGYYLLGVKKLNKYLFEHIEWSTQYVLSTTIKRCEENDLTYFLLDKLHDVDDEKDLVYLNNVG